MHTPLSRRQFLVASAGLTVTAATGTSAQAQAPADWSKIIEAAKKEGSVTVYSGYVSPDTHDAINKAFTAKYGIKVDLLMARGTEIRERVRTEQATGRFIADVWHTALSNMTEGTMDQQYCQPHGGMPSAAGRLKPEFAKRANEFHAPIFTINYGFMVNTRLVKDGDEPKSWQDLLDPKWKGKIMSDDPRASGGGRVMFHMTTDRFGREYHEKLAKQELVFSRDYQESARRIARGEYPVYIPFILSIAPTLKGLPMKYVIPAEGATYGSYGAPIFKNPPHPNAARLLADFYLSEEAQAVYAKTGHGIVVNKLTTPLTPEQAEMANVKPLVDEDFTRINAMYALAKEIYK